MDDELGTSARGTAVERLHRVLTSQGHGINRDEIDRSDFGVSTLAGLREPPKIEGIISFD